MLTLGQAGLQKLANPPLFDTTRCGRKRRHASQGKAEAAIRALIRRGPGPAQRRAAGGISLSPLSFMACRTSSTPHNHGRSGIVSRQFLATNSYKMTCGNHADYDPPVDYHFPRETPEDHPSRAQTALQCGSLNANRRSTPGREILAQFITYGSWQQDPATPSVCAHTQLRYRRRYGT